MPGAGGGSHGGGGGGFHGGGHSSGGYYRGGVYVGGNRVAAPNSIGSAIFSMVFMLLFFGIFALAVLLPSSSDRGNRPYDETTMQEYAAEQYDAIFDKDNGYEDNILLVIVNYEGENSTYEYLVWYGDNLTWSIHYMFGDDSVFTDTLERFASPYSFRTSLGADIADTFDYMAAYIDEQRVGSPFRSEGTRPAISYFRNDSTLSVNESIVLASLQNFTSETEIPVAVVVTNSALVFGENSGCFANVEPELMVILVIVAVIAVIVFASSIKTIITCIKKKNGETASDSTYTRGYNINGRENSDGSGTDNW